MLQLNKTLYKVSNHCREAMVTFLLKNVYKLKKIKYIKLTRKMIYFLMTNQSEFILLLTRKGEGKCL